MDEAYDIQLYDHVYLIHDLINYQLYDLHYEFRFHQHFRYHQVFVLKYDLIFSSRFINLSYLKAFESNKEKNIYKLYIINFFFKMISIIHIFHF